MRIVYVYKALAIIGGIERVLIDKMNYLAERYGYDVTIITTCQGDHTVPFALSPKVKHIDLNIRFHTRCQYPLPKRWWVKYQMTRRFEQLLKQHVERLSPDVLVVTVDKYMDTVTKLFPHIPIVAESHSIRSHTPYGDPHLGFLNRYTRERYLQTAKKVDALVTLTEGDAKEFDLPQTVIIPNCIHLFPDRVVNKCDSKKAIFVGRFAEQKGVDYVIDAWKEIHKQHPDWQLYMYGDGESRDYYIQLVSHLGLQDTIIVCNPVTDIQCKYQESSLLLLTSVYESFALVLPEAMLCGVACVAFNCPYGPADIIDSGKDGILVPSKDVKALVEKVNYLIENPSVRKAMAKLAQTSALRYHPDVIMPMWKQLFERLAAGERIR